MLFLLFSSADVKMCVMRILMQQRIDFVDDDDDDDDEK
jgi:hypothetical protein